LANQLHPARWLPAAFFDTGSDNHALWSIHSFKTWITVYKPHVHAESGTVFGGPLGIRNLVFAASRMHQNIDFARQHESPPRDISHLIRGPRRVWSDNDTRRELDSCIAILRTDIARSRTILQVTYQERLLTWRAAIIDSAEKLIGLPGPKQTEIGVSATSGIPKTPDLIREMYEEIVANLQEETDIQGEQSRVSQTRVNDRLVPLSAHTRARGESITYSASGNITGMREGRLRV
jgi:hypothetical protein